jgi:hypothetical protein
MFNKKQLFVIWFVGAVVCFFVLQSSMIFGDQALTIYKSGMLNWKVYYSRSPYAVNWFRLSLIPIILGALLVITLSKK